MNQQKGFTLIELIVVIVILGILAATALPKFSDLSGDARVAKMKAAKAALQSGAALVHASWLTAGSPAALPGNSTFGNSIISMEGTRIAFINGYPDVGGDGSADTASSAANSGILLAAGGLADYDTTTTAATATVLTILPDSGHTACALTYTQAAAGGTPTISDAGVTVANCK